MDNNLLEVTDYKGPGYKALVYFEGWRVAFLNDDPSKYRVDTIGYLERHNETDEVFVLLQGQCILLIGEGKDDGSLGKINCVTMEPNKFYNVKKGVWHNLIAEENMVLLIVENADTSDKNSDYATVTSADIEKALKDCQAK